MLKNRNLYLLAGVLAVLILVSLLQGALHRKSVSRPAETKLLQTELQAADVARVALGYGADSTAVVLERLPDRWSVRSAYGFPASQPKIDELLKAQADLRGEFRSNSADVLDDYSLDRDHAVNVTVFGKDFQPVLRLLVGKRPAGATGDFVRRPGSNEVYLTSASLLNALSLYGGPAKPQSRNFIELQAYKAERDDVDAILLEDNGQTIELVKDIQAKPATAGAPGYSTKGGVDRSIYEWRLVKPKAKPALKTKADALLSALTTIRAADVADPKGDLMGYGLLKAARKATLRLKTGKSFTLYFGGTRPEAPDQPGGVFMRTDADNTIWVVRESLLAAMFPKADDLLPGPVKPAAPPAAKPGAKPAAKTAARPAGAKPGAAGK